MRRKIKKIVMAAVLSVAVLGMSFSAIPASAATGSVDEHKHRWIEDKSKQIFLGYTNASDFYHQKQVEKFYNCSDCTETMSMVVLESEPHSPDPKTQRCACGYVVH